MEHNRECEFGVDSYDDFCAALILFGFEVDIRKRKRGRAWRHDGLLIEAVEVDELGRFIEIELLIDERHASPQAHRQGDQRVQDMLTQLDIPLAAIEPRRYIDLLRSESETG